MRFKKTLITAGIMVAAIGTVSACSAAMHTSGTVTQRQGASVATDAGKPKAPAAESKIPTGKAGDTIAFTHGDNKIDVTVGAPTPWAGTDYVKPQKGATFTVVKVSIDVTAGQYNANPYYFHLVTADGSRYSQSFMGTPDPQLPAASLATGQKLTGNIGFDVPAAQLAGAHVDVDGTGMDMLSTAGIWQLP